MKSLHIYIIALLFSAVSLSSCEKFLDVKPAREVTSDDLLEDRKGYESALAGLYFDLGSSALYGGNLTFNFMDALAGYWDISHSEHRYYRLNNYDYSALESQVNSFWAPMYEVIFNANNLINSLEDKGDLNFNERLVLGEAVGIRAFVHLDLFRIYGPVVVQEGLSAKSLPYRKKADAVIEPFLPAEDYLNQVLADLNWAKELLAEDPIIENGGTGNGNVSGGIDYNSLLDRRRNRFNINAATGMMARVYQLLGDQQVAREYALTTIENTSAEFVTSTDFNQTTTADTRLTKEIVFGLYLREHYELTRGVFGIDGSSVNVTSSLIVNYDNLQNFIFQDASGDYRRNRWFQNSLNYTVFTRYAEAPPAQDQFLAYRPEMSLLSISELYYIIAESYMSEDPQKSYEYLNEVLKIRGFNALLDVQSATPETAMKELVKEVRRQYYGEGQLFFFLKRHFLDIEKSSSSIVPAALGIFKLPIPKNELEFNN